MAADKPPRERDPLSVAVGTRIATIMETRRISQSDLAASMGSSPAYVWRIIDGRQNLSLRLMGRICLALDTTLSNLFKGIAVPPDIGGTRAYGATTEE